MTTRPVLWSAFAVLLLAAPLTAADDWPHWRGPLASGVSSEAGLPVEWGDTRNVAWKASIAGVGVSSPIVVGERVFVTSQTGSGEVQQGPRLVQGGDPSAAGERSLGTATSTGDDTVTFLVSAFERASGRRAWEVKIPAQAPFTPVHDKHNMTSPSPASDGERVYAWFATGQIAAIDLAGKVVWQKHLGKDFGAFEIIWGHSSSPIVHDGQLLLLCYHERASYLLSLDARSGAVRWKADAPAGTTSYSTPLVVRTADGRSELVVNSSTGLSGHDLANGQRLWQVEESNRFPVPMPLAHEGTIYTSRGYRSSPYWAIRPGGRGDVTASHVAWRISSGAPYISSLLHYNGLLYMMGDVGVLSVVDAASGERVHQERLGGVYTASPVAGDGKVYLVSEDGETIVLSAGRTPKVLARNRLSARQLASPAISGGKLFIRSDDGLFAIGR